MKLYSSVLNNIFKSIIYAVQKDFIGEKRKTTVFELINLKKKMIKEFKRVLLTAQELATC